MTVTSTEFQQNVGHYLALADQGEEISIEKKKPKKAFYTLKKRKEPVVKDEDRTTINGMSKKDFLEMIQKYSFKSECKGEIGLALQRRVRS